MRSLCCSSLAALLTLSPACDKTGADAPVSTADPGAPSSGGAPAATLKGPIELPAGVPKGVMAVFSVRVPGSMFESIVAADPMGIATDGMKDLERDLGAFFAKTMGIQILEASAVTGFALGEKDFGVVIEGVTGGIKTQKVGEHAGVALHGSGVEEIRMAQQGDTLLLGTEAAVKASIDASTDSAKSAAGGELASFIAGHSEGATVAVAADIGRLPKELTRGMPPTVAVDRGLLTFGPSGLSLRAEGGEDEVAALAGVISSALAMASSEAERQRERALEESDDVAEGATMIIAAHYMRVAKKRLEPKVEGGALTMSVPLQAGDPAILAAVAGIGAAIAIPAFMKYTRRSKTSEARVHIAMMFDGASMYFNEERVQRPATSLDPADVLDAAPHECPNNGNLKGESGITPPLSVDCSAGPGGRCVPSVGAGGEPGYYDMTLWTENEVWNALNFQQEQGHYFHYNFIWSNEAEGYGACQFTAQAFGDLDGDGIFSTFERSGAADQHGVNGAAGLYIDNEVE